MIRLALAAFALAAAFFVPPADAGIGDTPLPSGFKLLYSVPAISGAGQVGPVFTCTNAGKSQVTIGVELFDSTGAAAGNPATNRLVVPAGGTVNWALGAVTSMSVDNFFGVAFGNGKASARIVATSTKVLCTAYMIDYSGGGPQANLTVVAKTKQKGE